MGGNTIRKMGLYFTLLVFLLLSPSSNPFLMENFPEQLRQSVSNKSFTLSMMQFKKRVGFLFTSPYTHSKSMEERRNHEN
jgi:hypothetical protein